MHQVEELPAPLKDLLDRIEASMHQHPAQAIELCEQVFADAQAMREPLAHVMAAERYGQLMDHIGHSVESRNRLFAAQQVAQSALLFSHEARLLEQIARSFYSSSEHRLALQYWIRCLEVSEAAGGDAGTWIAAKVGLAQIYFGLGDHAAALALLIEAEKRIGEVNDHHLHAKVKINLGVGFSETGKVQEATEAFAKALGICTRYQLLDYLAESNFYLGKIELADSRLDAAMAYLDAALAAAREVNFRWCEAQILASQARVHASRGQYPAAVESIKAAQAIAVSKHFLHMLIQQHYLAAEFAEKTGDLQAAIVEYKAAHECETQVNAASATERNKELEEKAGLRPSISRRLVDLSNNLIIDQGELEPAFELIARESCSLLNIPRASLWLLDHQSGTLVCRCLFLADEGRYARAETLQRERYPIFFERLMGINPIVAHDARHHPHTVELQADFLAPNAIRSLLTFPIRLGGQTSGVLTFAMCERQRNWSPDDLLYGKQLTEISARVIAGFEHKIAQEEINALNARMMRANDMLQERVMERTVSLERHALELREMQNKVLELQRGDAVAEAPASPAMVSPEGPGSLLPRVEASSEVQESRLRSLVQLSCDWCWEQDTQFRTVYVDDQGHAENTFTPTFMIGKRLWDFQVSNLNEDDWARHRTLLERREAFFDLELHLSDGSGNQRWISLNGRPAYDAAGEFAGYLGTGKDVYARKANEDRNSYLATHDTLTTLPNRLLFSEFLNRAIHAGRRYERRFAVAFIDLDRFKIINDTLGHEAGDTLLKVVSMRLQECLRVSDVVARLGGDEFVLLLEHVESQDVAAGIASKILTSVIRPVTLLGQECRVTASIGICMYTGEEDEQTMMKNADIAMYQAKEGGKNNYRFYDENVKSQSLERMMLENSLRRALEAQQFFLHYQAKMDLQTNSITGVEALIRWHHPELGDVPPLRFIPLAEETGLIVPIGRWVLHESCMQNVAWQRMGLPPLSIAVNLSSRQFIDDALLTDINDALEKSGMDPTLLELELTESMVIQNVERAAKLLGDIKALGVRLAIDDFGTGYSSLAQLKNFPIDTLKVDRSFIQNLPNNFEDGAITRAIIDMGKTLHLTVVAEGVENEEQQAFLRDSFCDEIQGFHFSRPVEPDQFFKLWQEVDGQGRS